MSQPAARLGDLTAHGGTVTSGNPTVLINGQPAATVGDMHVCPMCSPGPHVGGPVMVGAPTVLIGGRPAARVGDACTCAAPSPDVIVQGSPNVLIGGASGAASPGAAAMAASAHGASLAPGTPGTGATARPLSPWVGVGYQDEEARSVAGWAYHAEAGSDERDGQVGSGGQVWADALAESGAVEVGLVGVYGCRWAKDEARVGEEVGMSARCVGIEDGELAQFEVWREAVAADGSFEREKVWEVMGEVAGGRVEAMRPFVFAWTDGSREEATSAGDPNYVPESAPPPPDASAEDGGGVGHEEGLAATQAYLVEVSIGGVHRALGGRLQHQDWVEVELATPDGRPLGRASFVIETSDGARRSQVTDGQGTARIDGVPPGPYTIRDVKPPTQRNAR